MAKDNNPKIQKSPDDWGYMLLDSNGVITRVWAIPSDGKKFFMTFTD